MKPIIYYVHDNEENIYLSRILVGKDRKSRFDFIGSHSADDIKSFVDKNEGDTLPGVAFINCAVFW